MATYWKINFFILVCFSIINFIHSKDCLDDTKYGLKHLGSKTPYRLIANTKDSAINYNGCTPLKIIGILRHGTRTPGKKVVTQIEEKLDDIIKFLKEKSDDSSEESDDSSEESDELCENEEKNLKKWKLKIENDGEKFLTHEGEDEMIELAERYQNRFPSLLNRNYDNDTFLFRFTDTQRTKESAKHFTVGLFGKKESKKVWFPKPIYEDPILRFYKLCAKWNKDVKKNPESKKELEEYKSTKEVNETLEEVSKRLNLNYTLDFDIVHIMYITCSFETAWNKIKKSPWCSVLSKKDFKVMEYAEELKHYWRDGYGYDLNHRQACPLVDDIFSIIENRNTTSTFYFTHSGTILKLLSHLGLFKDDFTLTHNIKEKQKDKRRWRISFIDAFSSNVVFVLYKCEDGLKVLTLHQERILKLPFCPEKGLCSLDLMKKHLVESIDHCNFNHLCAL